MCYLILLRVDLSYYGTMTYVGKFLVLCITKSYDWPTGLSIYFQTSGIALYDVDTVSTVRVEIWKEIMFLFFYLSLFYLFFLFFHPTPHQKKMTNMHITFLWYSIRHENLPWDPGIRFFNPWYPSFQSLYISNIFLYDSQNLIFFKGGENVKWD